MNIINFIFGFRGRTNRAYFALLLPLFITIQILMVFFSLAISNALASAKQMSLQVSDLMEIFTVLLIFPIYFWLKYAYVAKRAHDFNKKAPESKLVYIMFMVDLSLSIGVTLFQNFGLAVPSLIISLICLITLSFKKGDQEENYFGKPQVPFWSR